jgi:acyl-CoA reductase-like NAD-dependent aldehyde dehydrogenase
VAGNTVVVKSAEEAPFGVLRVAQLSSEILPPGVFNISRATAPAAAGPWSPTPEVGKVTFTGSVETGRIISRAAAEKLIPVTLELGGKSPMIVMGDADFDLAVAGAVTGMRFTRQGQSCTAASRILVERTTPRRAFCGRAQGRRDGHGRPAGRATDIGTIISAPSFDRAKSYIGRATPGAEALECSAMPTDPRFAEGLFVRPVIFLGLDNESAASSARRSSGRSR